MSEEPREKPSNFIRDMVAADTASGRLGGKVVTRFPPEPNGYLHIGHAKAICIDFGIAQEFGGRCNLRFDDTDPTKESVEYVESIMADVHWLGFDWGEHVYYASDYFEQLYEWAVQLIKDGKAYVDELTAEQVAEYRGTLTTPGRESPYRRQHQPARSRHVPHPQDPAPSHGRQVVHLSHVRLGPRPVRLDRGRDPFHLHARVRGPPPAL